VGKFKIYLNEQRVIGKTSVDKDHYHEYQVDVHGNGKTISTMNDKATALEHIHKIFKWNIEKAGDHIHTIVKEPVTE
jgi:hypothetical protein